jgi:hypothetical protein
MTETYHVVIDDGMTRFEGTVNADTPQQAGNWFAGYIDEKHPDRVRGSDVQVQVRPVNRSYGDTAHNAEDDAA